MSIPIFINTLPFHIKIEGNETKEFYFTDNVKQFVIFFKNFNPKLKVQLIGIGGHKKDYFIEKNNEPIDKSVYSIIRFTNTDNSIIEIILNN